MDDTDRLENMGGSLSRDLAAQIAKENRVRITDILTAIHVFHEAAGFGHYSIQLFPDGSGNVQNRKGETVFTFRKLPRLVEKASQLIKKHGIKWGK